MILRDALDIRRGTAQRNKIYKGTYKVWDRNKIALEGYCKQVELPSEYQQVEYIEKNGGQYIDLNETATIDCEIGIDCYIANYNSGNKFIMGCRSSGCSAIIGLQPKLVYQFGNMSSSTFSRSITLNQRYKIVANNTGCYVDDELYYSYSGGMSVNESTNHIKLFATSGSTDVVEFSASDGTKMYNAYVKKNGIYTRNLIPCYRKSDNEIGMYDIVNNVFYTNAGTGTFLKGNNVQNPDYPQEIEVMQGRQVVQVKGTDYTVDLKSRNLFDVNDIYSNAGQVNVEDWITITGDNSQGEAVLYKNYFTKASKLLRKNTTYYIVLEIKAITGQGRIVLVSNYSGDTSASQFKNTIAYNFSDLNNQDIIIINDTTKDDFTNISTMLRTYVSFNAGQSGSITFRLSVLEEQPTVESFNYEPYYDYKLAGIGDYKDNFYTDKGKWYFKQNIKKHDLIGQMAEAEVNNVFFTTEINDYALADNIPYSNRFKGISNVNGADALTNADDNVISFINSTDYTRLYIKSTKFADYNAINVFLTNNKTYLYYLLKQPIITEIPSRYTTLINQLNALYQAM